MLNEDKIRLMNEIAMYEKKEARRMRPARKYFRDDYVAKHMLQSFFAYTLSCALLLSVAFLYRLDWILNAADMPETLVWVKRLLILYFSGLALFELLTALIYRRRYALAERRRERGLLLLNRLKKRYDIRERRRELFREGGRNA